MTTVHLFTDAEAEADPAVKAVFDDIRATRKSDFVNNIWRGLAADPALTAPHLGAGEGRDARPRRARPAGARDDLHRGLGDEWLLLLRPFAHRGRRRPRASPPRSMAN
ncbi:MAG: hypothetical protein WDN49_20890 [Acetobacteraceae bacterium]